MNFTLYPLILQPPFVLFLEAGQNVNQFGSALHKYCSKNYQQLHKRFIIYVENVKGRHWITHVFINPFAVIADLVLGETSEFEHGLFTYDPTGSAETKGSAGKNHRPPDWEGGQLIFLLNSLSHYRDLKVHGLLEKATKPQTWEEIWMIGGRGPFGIYFDKKCRMNLTVS